ncbi:MAG TPA: hypothetical protein VLT87_08585 [Thermoanaerobaculia bacterium]|nr:hypothetical protein [Thermoanaerobaculia bacterium]
MPLGSLWLPVIVSAVAVWLVSAIVHMVLKYHRADYKQLSDEESIAQAVRKVGPGPGLYVMPYCADMSQMKDPAFRKKYDEGPVALLTVMRNGPPALGKNLAQWFALCFLVSFVTAYVARHTLSPATDGLEVMRITGTVAFIAYGFGYIQDSIWKAIPWGNSLRGLLDAAIYGLVTGLVFRFLWPGA